MDDTESQDEEFPPRDLLLDDELPYPLPPRPVRNPPDPVVARVSIAGAQFGVVDYTPPPQAATTMSANPTTTGEVAQCVPTTLAAVLPVSEGTPPVASSPTSMDVTPVPQSGAVPQQPVGMLNSGASSSSGEDWWFDYDTGVWYYKPGAGGTWVPWVEVGAPPAKRQRQDKPEGED